MQGATAALMSTIFSDGCGLKNVTSKMSNQELTIRFKINSTMESILALVGLYLHFLPLFLVLLFLPQILWSLFPAIISYLLPRHVSFQTFEIKKSYDRKSHHDLKHLVVLLLICKFEKWVYLLSILWQCRFSLGNITMMYSCSDVKRAPRIEFTPKAGWKHGEFSKYDVSKNLTKSRTK